MLNTRLLLLILVSAHYLPGQIAVEEISPELDAQLLASEKSGPEDFSLYGILGYESIYVISGAQGAYASVQPDVGIEYLGAYAGVWANLPIDSQSNNPNGPFGDEYNFYFGYGHGFFDEMLVTAVGATYYWFPDTGSIPNHTWELNIAVGLDILLEPTIEYNYDFNLEQNEVVFVISHEFDLHAWTVEGLSIDTTASIGYLHANDTNSNQAPFKDADGYAYFEAVANLVYTIEDTFSIYAGPRIATNNNGTSNLAERETNLWWGIGGALDF